MDWVEISSAKLMIPTPKSPKWKILIFQSKFFLNGIWSRHHIGLSPRFIKLLKAYNARKAQCWLHANFLLDFYNFFSDSFFKKYLISPKKRNWCGTPCRKLFLFVYCLFSGCQLFKKSLYSPNRYYEKKAVKSRSFLSEKVKNCSAEEKKAPF